MAVDRMAEKVCVSLYRLAPYHHEINLIELVRSEIKRRVAVNNTQFDASFMSSLIGYIFYVIHTAGT